MIVAYYRSHVSIRYNVLFQVTKTLTIGRCPLQVRPTKVLTLGLDWFSGTPLD